MAATRSPVVMTWEELENCSELDRRKEPTGTLLTISTGSHASNNQAGAQTAASLQSTAGPRSRPHQGPVQILRRHPNSDPSLTTSGDGSQSRPIRSLEEREAAYAEARARILGSANSSPAPGNAPGGGARERKQQSNGRSQRNKQDSRQASAALTGSAQTLRSGASDNPDPRNCGGLNAQSLTPQGAPQCRSTPPPRHGGSQATTLRHDAANFTPRGQGVPRNIVPSGNT